MYPTETIGVGRIIRNPVRLIISKTLSGEGMGLPPDSGIPEMSRGKGSAASVWEAHPLERGKGDPGGAQEGRGGERWGCGERRR